MDTLFTDVFVDKTVVAQATIPAFGFDGLRLFAEFAVDDFDGFDFLEFKNALGFEITTFGAAACLPAVDIQALVMADSDLVDVKQAWYATLADIFVINQFDDAISFRGFAELVLELDLRLGGGGDNAGDDQCCACGFQYHCDALRMCCCKHSHEGWCLQCYDLAGGTGWRIHRVYLRGSYNDDTEIEAGEDFKRR